jgi:ATP-dependent exoDNAse (exonuclease V) alpha subunit
MFVSGVGGTGKSFLIKTIRALVTKVWHNEKDSLLCAVSAPTGLAAFNVGGVTIHRLLQRPIEHEGRAAGYWRVGKDSLKIMRSSLSKLRVLIIDEVSMVSNLNLAYIHLRLDEIFAREQWFGGVNVLFVGDILQLPPVNGAPVFEKVSNKSVALKLGCMTSVNIWQETVLYEELTINERQKADLVFSSMLDEVRRGCPSPETLQAL